MEGALSSGIENTRTSDLPLQPTQPARRTQLLDAVKRPYIDVSSAYHA